MAVVPETVIWNFETKKWFLIELSNRVGIHSLPSSLWIGDQEVMGRDLEKGRGTMFLILIHKITSTSCEISFEQQQDDERKREEGNDAVEGHWTWGVQICVWEQELMCLRNDFQIFVLCKPSPKPTPESFLSIDADASSKSQREKINTHSPKQCATFYPNSSYLSLNDSVYLTVKKKAVVFHLLCVWGSFSTSRHSSPPFLLSLLILCAQFDWLFDEEKKKCSCFSLHPHPSGFFSLFFLNFHEPVNNIGTHLNSYFFSIDRIRIQIQSQTSLSRRRGSNCKIQLKCHPEVAYSFSKEDVKSVF